MTKAKVERGRVKRAVKQIKIFEFDETGLPLPDSHYLAVGGESLHYVHTKPFWECDCADWLCRDYVCKHLLAALLYEGNEVIRGVAETMLNDRSQYTFQTSYK